MGNTLWYINFIHEHVPPGLKLCCQYSGNFYCLYDCAFPCLAGRIPFGCLELSYCRLYKLFSFFSLVSCLFEDCYGVSCCHNCLSLSLRLSNVSLCCLPFPCHLYHITMTYALNIQHWCNSLYVRLVICTSSHLLSEWQVNEHIACMSDPLRVQQSWQQSSNHSWFLFTYLYHKQQTCKSRMPK